MLLEVELLGIGDDGSRYEVGYKWGNDIDEDTLRLYKKSFLLDYSNVFLKNRDSFTVASLLIHINNDLVFKDVVTTEKEYELSVVSKGADAILNLAINFIPTRMDLVD